MDKVIEAINILKEVANESSTLEKKRILKEKATDMTKTILKFNFDPAFKTFISGKKIEKAISNKKTIKSYTDDKMKVNSFEEFLDYLENKSTGKDMDILVVQQYINSVSSEHKQFLKELAQKHLVLGIGKKDLNKVFPGFLRLIEPMLAQRLDKYPEAIVGETLYLTEKLDGNRIVILNHAKDFVEIFSRDGLKLDKNLFPEIVQDLKSLPIGQLYDGEMIAIAGATALEQFKNTSTIMRSKGIKKGLTYQVFDSFPISEWETGESKETYTERRKWMDKTFAGLQTGVIKLVQPLYIGVWSDECDKIFRDLLSKGAEGAMLNIGSAKYQVGKRSKGILKIKQYEDSDLRVIGFEIGKGRNSSRLGKFLVSYKGETVGVGSGIVDDMRETVWANKEDYLGTIIQVKHFGESTDKNGKVSLRHPTFERLRPDKDEPNE